MNCQFTQSRLSPFIDGELSGREMLLVRDHLNACICCNREYEKSRALKQLVGALPPAKVEGDFADKLIATVRSSPHEPVSPIWPTWRMSLALAATAVAAFSILYFRGGNKPAIPEPNDPPPLARDVIALDQEWNSARGVFPANTIPATLNGGR